MKLINLNQRGFSHELIVVSVFALVAIAGVGYSVQNNQNKKTDVLGASSSRPDKKKTYCEIKNVPKKPRHEVLLNPVLVIHNKGADALTPKVRIYSGVYMAQGQEPIVTSPADPLQLALIQPKGTLRTKPFSPFTVPYKSKEKGYKGFFAASSYNPDFTCQANFTFPKQPKQSSKNTAEYGPVIVAPAQ